MLWPKTHGHTVSRSCLVKNATAFAKATIESSIRSTMSLRLSTWSKLGTAARFIDRARYAVCYPVSGNLQREGVVGRLLRRKPDFEPGLILGPP